MNFFLSLSLFLLLRRLLRSIGCCVAREEENKTHTRNTKKKQKTMSSIFNFYFTIIFFLGEGGGGGGEQSANENSIPLTTSTRSTTSALLVTTFPAHSIRPGCLEIPLVSLCRLGWSYPGRRSVGPCTIVVFIVIADHGAGTRIVVLRTLRRVSSGAYGRHGTCVR